MTEKPFDSARNKSQITFGTYFWCHSHLAAIELSKQSPDPRYCSDCYDFLVEEKKQDINHGKKDWWPVVSEKRQQGKQGVVEVVAKIAGVVNDGVVIMQQPNKRGRPLKTGEVVRSTVWRRRVKQGQAVLL